MFDWVAISHDSDDFIPFTSQQNEFELQSLIESESLKL